MTSKDREISSFLAIKGIYIEETFRAFRDWDLNFSADQNLKHIQSSNSIGAPSAGWLRNFLWVTHRRYRIDHGDLPLIQLAKAGWHIDDWRPLLLWHSCNSDELLRLFLAEWLFSKREEEIVAITTQSVHEFLSALTTKRLGAADAWTESTISRAASKLLKTAVEFRLLEGRKVKSFAAYRLPESSFMYLLHALMDREKSTRRVVDARDWQVFLMRPQDVEEELLRLHQFGKLRFERAGTFLELTLPCKHAEEFIRSRAG
jgi:hypothetical protein